MRNHIVIVSEESVYSGHYKCGIGEVVDCMAAALRDFYDVTLITVGTGGGGRLGGTITCGVEGELFLQRAADHINMICPDLVHNFASPALIELLTVSCPKVLTFDRWEEDAAGYLDVIPKYDHVTTLSTAYAEEMKAAHPEAAAWPLKGIIGAIDGGLYCTSDGIWGNDGTARAKYYKLRGVEDTGKKLIVSMGRLLPIKGIQNIIDDAPAIAAMGADLVIYGTGDPALEEQLTALHEAGVLTYYHRMLGYSEMMLALRGADFYLMPSLSEVCGLQPMKAARVGCVPIVRPIGGLGENFDESTAILITSTVSEAVSRALALTDTEYQTIKKNCEGGSWTWETRILPWVELYGLETAPREETAIVRNVQNTTTAKPRVKSPFATIEEDDDNE